MSLSRQVAGAIVSRVKDILGCDVNIMDQHGVIIASTNPDRINAFHEGAAKVLSTGVPLEISSSDAVKLEGSRPGMNLPISLNRQTVGVVGLTGEPCDIRQFGELVKNMVEVMITQSFISEQLQAVTDARKTLILNILHGNLMDFDEETVQIQGRLFGYDLSLPRICIIFNLEQGIRGPMEESENTQYMTGTVARVFGRDHVSAYLGGGYLAVLPSISKPGASIDSEVRRVKRLCESVATATQSGLVAACFVGIGRYYESLRDLSSSYNEAVRALRIGKTLYKNPALRAAGFSDRVYDLGSLGMYAVISSLPPQVVQLLREHSVGSDQSLVASLGPSLTSTLLSFLLRNLNLQKTAESMHLHRNTLAYRLDRIREVTGKDARKFNDAVELALVLFNELIAGEADIDSLHPQGAFARAR